MGRRMLTNMTTHGGFHIAMVWDPSAEACRVVEEQFTGVKVGSTAEQAITDPAIDVVYIASPPSSHRQYVVAAAAAGKAVFCEKPLGIDVSDSRTMVEAVDTSGVPNAVNFPFADAQAVTMIQAKLKDGSVGDVMGVDIRLHFSRWPRDWQETASWLALRKEGGYIREVGSHFVFLLEKLFGPATLVDASVRYPTDEALCETHVFARLDCNGTTISLAGGSGGMGPDTVEFTVWGSNTSYRLWNWNRLKSTRGEGWHDELTDLKDPRQDGYMRVLENFLRLLQGGTHTMPSLRAALSVQEIVEKILLH